MKITKITPKKVQKWMGVDLWKRLCGCMRAHANMHYCFCKLLNEKNKELINRAEYTRKTTGRIKERLHANTYSSVWLNASIKAQKANQAVWLPVWLRSNHSTQNIPITCCKEIWGTKMKLEKKRTKRIKKEETFKYDVGETLESFIQQLERKVAA